MFSLAQIDRAFFEVIRLRLVAEGYCPDRAINQTEAALKAAKQAIANSGKQLIEIFGTGNYEDRQAVKNNKIVIHRLNIDKGNIGGWGVNQYQEQSSSYLKTKLPAETVNINYQISYLTNSIAYDRIIHEILFSLFTKKGNLQGVNEDGSKTANFFDYERIDYKDLSADKYIEKAIRYQTTDIVLAEEVQTIGSISRIETIDTNLQTS